MGLVITTFGFKERIFDIVMEKMLVRLCFTTDGVILLPLYTVHLLEKGPLTERPQLVPN